MPSQKTPVWPVDTLLVCMRNARRDNNWGGTRGVRAEKVQGARENAPPMDYPEPTLQSGEALYPFTKGIDLTNDGLGYGEETSLPLRLPDGTPATRIARRTRTGSRRFGPGVPGSGPGSEPPRASSSVNESLGRSEVTWRVDLPGQPEDAGRAGRRDK